MKADESELAVPKAASFSTRFHARVQAWRGVPVTTGVCLVFIAVFVTTLLVPQKAVPALLAPRAFDIWRGSFLGLCSLLVANFVHLQAWHLALNVSALWYLAPTIERAVGFARFTGLLLGGGLAASGLQLAMFGNIGIGGSGMLYGLFGFAWAASRIYPQLRETLTLNVSAAWVGWFLACWLAPALHVANGGHLGGLVFGVVAGLGTGRSTRFLRRGVPAAVVALVVAAGLFPIWQAGWWAAMGYRAHHARDYREAIDAYTVSLDMDPSQAWVRTNLVTALASSGRFKEARASLDELQRRDPEAARKVLEGLERDGKAAWAH